MRWKKRDILSSVIGFSYSVGFYLQEDGGDMEKEVLHTIEVDLQG